jgi:hypothetical protein
MIGRPQTHPVKKIIGFTGEMVETIEKWRKKQKPELNFSEAVRQLIGRGLALGSSTRKR